MRPVEVIPAAGLSRPLALLEGALRDGQPVSADFAERLRRAVEAGDMEVLVGRIEERPAGVAVIAYRPNVSAGTLFASIEDLYVRPDARRRGVGRALLRAADERCKMRGISYVEVQIEDDGAEAFYAALGFEPEHGVRLVSRSLPIDNTEKADG